MRLQERKETAEVGGSDEGPLGFQPTPLTGEQGRLRSPGQIFKACKDANLSMSAGVKVLRGSGKRKTGN